MLIVPTIGAAKCKAWRSIPASIFTVSDINISSYKTIELAPVIIIPSSLLVLVAAVNNGLIIAAFIFKLLNLILANFILSSALLTNVLLLIVVPIHIAGFLSAYIVRYWCLFLESTINSELSASYTATSSNAKRSG